mmetsp:Transcript_18401/g.51580  ORF Transcript_18401/g.51580 Transcript_18401/m.51580 type:complete len:357 (-) Transcript_18401:378-1448(-)|eukprot:CAMPEP_0202350170 /NCGR_PEP_ID=MMETSP1126-20121109/7350_1 /ASSEMBLY_ACC=CAM_ASM_000457 /TAXON_ID=3047 /ORGANISM="Dunaliella tertiolecta, Strain CCMP1320" /LENGTH=356 /DNA_ID=CAMNT_0048942089 /DNA_START=71 /DNA_END=1141 /DNA_ORIENTATION=+
MLHKQCFTRSKINGVVTPARKAFISKRLVPRTVVASVGSSSSFSQADLKELDDLLSRDEQQKALEFVQRKKDEGVLKHYGINVQMGVPKRQYTIEELRLNKIDAPKIISPTDSSLSTARRLLQVAALAGLTSVAYTSEFDAGRIIWTTFALIFAVIFDQVANGGGGQGLLVDSLGRIINPSYKQRVALHEAGHMLVAYIVGILPRAYTLSSWDAFVRYRALNVQAGTQFCDTQFQAEVASGRLSSSSLDRFTCVALAGVVTEYLRFEQAEGGLGDILQLDVMLKALGFSQMKADSEVRWAVLNVAAILRRYSALQDKLADAMDKGASTAACICLIEEELRLEEAKDEQQRLGVARG